MSSFNFKKFISDINSRLDQLSEDKKKQVLDKMAYDRERAEATERLASRKQQFAEDKETDRLGDEASNSMARDNDAFFVAKGEISPEEYSMKWGGSPGGGGSSKGGGGTSRGGGGDFSENDKTKTLMNMAKDFYDIPSDQRPLTGEGKPMEFKDYVKDISGNRLAEQPAQGIPDSSQYFRNQRQALDANDLKQRQMFDRNTGVGFKDAAGNNLDARGASIQQNALGERSGKMANGSTGFLSYSDNQYKQPFSTLGAGEGNPQRFGNVSDVARAIPQIGQQVNAGNSINKIKRPSNFVAPKPAGITRSSSMRPPGWHSENVPQNSQNIQVPSNIQSSVQQQAPVSDPMTRQLQAGQNARQGFSNLLNYKGLQNRAGASSFFKALGGWASQPFQRKANQSSMQTSQSKFRSNRVPIKRKKSVWERDDWNF